MFSCAYANIHIDKIDSPVTSDFIAQSNACENSLRNCPRQVDWHMSEDAIAKFKEAQRQGWKHFAPLEALTTPPAARLVKFARKI